MTVDIFSQDVKLEGLAVVLAFGSDTRNLASEDVLGPPLTEEEVVRVGDQ